MCTHPISQVRHHQVYPGRATRLCPGSGLDLSLYISPIAHIAAAHGLMQQQYADDTQLYGAISIETLLSLSWRCLDELHIWFCWNGLLLNPDKTDAILLGTSMHSKTISTLNTINVAGTPVALSYSIKILSVVHDKNFTLDSHISTSCFYHIQALRHIRPALTDDVAKMVACSLVGSRLDYANSVLFGTSAKNLAHLHRIQSTLTRVVTMQRGRISISKTLSDLHWLLMKFCVDSKVATSTFKVLESGEPGYLYSRIDIAISNRTLRSSADSRKLFVIPSRTKIGAQAFRHSAPQVWNSLPLNIHSVSSVQSFKSRLKTHYFRQAFN